MPRLFSYGSLQTIAVQMAVLGRRLNGERDELPGFEMQTISHGGMALANIRLHSNSSVTGAVFEVSDRELSKVDEYERGDGYVRRPVTLASGLEAWVYVDAATDSEYTR